MLLYVRQRQFFFLFLLNDVPNLNFCLKGQKERQVLHSADFQPQRHHLLCRQMRLHHLLHFLHHRMQRQFHLLQCSLSDWISGRMDVRCKFCSSFTFDTKSNPVVFFGCSFQFDFSSSKFDLNLSSLCWSSFKEGFS